MVNKKAQKAALLLIAQQKQLLSATQRAKNKAPAPRERVKAAPSKARGAALPFAFGDTILLVGEGNFTFARALARNKQLFRDALPLHDAAAVTAAEDDDGDDDDGNHDDNAVIDDDDSAADDEFESVRDDDEFESVLDSNAADVDETRLSRAPADSERGRLIATSFDSADEVRQKYGVAASVLEELATTFAPFCTILHGVDARALAKDKRLARVRPKHIVFNFPHEGRGVKDEATSVARHRELLTQFLQSAVDLLVAQRCEASALIHVTVKRGLPYDKWNIVELARSSVTPPLKLAKTFRFEPSLYEGYSHGLTRGDDVAEGDHLAGALCVTYAFAIRNDAEHAAAKEVKRVSKARAQRPGQRPAAVQARSSSNGSGGWRKRNRLGTKRR